MPSISENTFGAKIANASQIATHLKTFADYVPPTPNISIDEYEALIATITTQNTSVATQKIDYSTAVNTRQQLFFKDAKSLEKVLTPIAATLKARLGKTAKQVKDLTTLIQKIRGEKKATPKAPKPADATVTTTDAVSQSERSFGSITQNFSDVITTLTSLGREYEPVNPQHKLPALTQKLADAKAASTNATATFGALKTSLFSRTQLYTDLSQRTQRIKDAVKSQYGQQSPQYALITSLKV